MENHEFKNICSITRCPTCDGFNLQYRYVRIHLDEASLIDTLKVVYEYESLDDEYRYANPLGLKYGFAYLSISNEDFKVFKLVVENAALNSIDVSKVSGYS